MAKSIILLLQPGDGSSSFLAQLSDVEGGATFLESSQMQVSTNTISWIVLVLIDYFVISLRLLVFSAFLQSNSGDKAICLQKKVRSRLQMLLVSKKYLKLLTWFCEYKLNALKLKINN